MDVAPVDLCWEVNAKRIFCEDGVTQFSAIDQLLNNTGRVTHCAKIIECGASHDTSNLNRKSDSGSTLPALCRVCVCVCVCVCYSSAGSCLVYSVAGLPTHRSWCTRISSRVRRPSLLSSESCVKETMIVSQIMSHVSGTRHTEPHAHFPPLPGRVHVCPRELHLSLLLLPGPTKQMVDPRPHPPMLRAGPAPPTLQMSKSSSAPPPLQ